MFLALGRCMSRRGSFCTQQAFGLLKKNIVFFSQKSEKFEILFFPQNLNFLIIWGFLGMSKNARAEISRKTHRRMPRDLSYETDLGPKTKIENQPIFRAL